jgi:hypothetical protein
MNRVLGRLTTVLKQILVEGYTSEDILDLPPDQLKDFVFTGKPMVFKVGSAQLLGTFTLIDNRLVIELAHIDGGGEGALPTISVLAEKYARQNNLMAVEWIVHAVHCANPIQNYGEFLNDGVFKFRMFLDMDRRST